jgi:uncharacterized protein involved in tolerance to divalent cations
MVNVIIYLDKAHVAKHLVDTLLKDGLIANASVHMDNVSYRIESSEVIENGNSVITAQTKSMLFTQIDKYIKETYGVGVPIYSLPITQASESFDSMIRSNTIKI